MIKEEQLDNMLYKKCRKSMIRFLKKLNPSSR